MSKKDKDSETAGHAAYLTQFCGNRYNSTTGTASDFRAVEGALHKFNERPSGARTAIACAQARISKAERVASSGTASIQKANSPISEAAAEAAAEAAS